MPWASLSASIAEHDRELVEVEVLARARRASAAAPCGLWAASTSTVGSMPMSCRRPGEVTLPSPSATTSWPRATRAVAEERLDRGDRDGGVLRLVVAVERQEEVGVAPGATADVDDLTADGDRGRLEREVDPLDRERRLV